MKMSEAPAGGGSVEHMDDSDEARHGLCEWISGSPQTRASIEPIYTRKIIKLLLAVFLWKGRRKPLVSLSRAKLILLPE